MKNNFTSSYRKRLKIKNSFDGNLNFGAKSFNIMTSRDEHLKNLKETLSKDSHIKKLHLTNFRKCPLCSDNSFKRLFIKDEFIHVRCNSCSMVYVNPSLEEESTHNIYLNEESYNKVLMNDLQIEMDNKRFNYSLDLIEHFCINHENIIDIGAGPGTFLKKAIERNWKASAIEVNNFCVKRLESYGIKVIKQSLFSKELKNNYDCVTLWAVLEHLLNPQQMLKKINHILKPKGVLAIIVPNFDSLVVRVLQSKCATFSGNTHVNHFNSKTLKYMLEKCGFKTIELETVFSEINTIQNYLSFEDPYLGTPDYLVDILTPEYIHKNLLGYALLGFFRKI